MKIKRFFILGFILVILATFSGCGIKTNENTLTIAVSIVPQETFVKAVAGDLVDVVTMIPPGNSPANYQPQPKQLTKLSDASVYFTIGVAAEEANILPKINDFNKDIKLVSLEDIVGDVYPDIYITEDEHHAETELDTEEDHDHSGRDPHIWLSPKRVKVMIETIKDELILLDPDNQSIYETNAASYLSKLDQIDLEIKQALSGVALQSFIIYHPSFGYFADDYGLQMVTIEEGGKEATAQRIQEIIDFAKQENIKFIFYQEEFDSNQAETIANEIGGATIKIAPLAPNYIENLRNIANEFKEVLK